MCVLTDLLNMLPTHYHKRRVSEFIMIFFMWIVMMCVFFHDSCKWYIFENRNTIPRNTITPVWSMKYLFREFLHICILNSFNLCSQLFYSVQIECSLRGGGLDKFDLSLLVYKTYSYTHFINFTWIFRIIEGTKSSHFRLLILGYSTDIALLSQTSGRGSELVWRGTVLVLIFLFLLL